MLNDIFGNVYVKSILMTMLPVVEMAVWFLVLNALGLFSTSTAPFAAFLVIGSVYIDRFVISAIKRCKGR